MKVRDVKNAADLVIISHLNDKQDFKLKTIDNCVIDKIILDDNNIPLAYGIVKRQSEAIILVNHDAPLRDRVRALGLLMKYAMLGVEREQIEQMHLFIKDERLATMFERKYGFVRTKDIVLVKDVGK